MFNFENSYLSLPNKFYSIVKPTFAGKPEMVLLNDRVCDELDISSHNPDDIISFFLGNELDNNTTSFAQAYAGHQFGNFTKLGDGRAIIIGEHITNDNKRFDIQLKGSGKTPYSRGGDGKATLKAMLREFLMSEAIHYLEIPTSRSLAVVKTGEQVYRETEKEGAMLARVMKSHLRIGTFEYARNYGTTDDLKALTDYTIQRLYPEIEQDENNALSLLKTVMIQQIDLVANWMRVGFIHGVMNTDNVAISGETFDYGPCAFINFYHPDTVFSSIDRNGRYAFGMQPNITKWNMSKFAEALLPIIHPDAETALKLAQKAIDEFDEIWQQKYYKMMLHKLGIEIAKPDLYGLVDELLELMIKLKMDYTNTFLALSDEISFADSAVYSHEFQDWLAKWKRIINDSNGFNSAKNVMKEHNPAFIPRNHLVEKALDLAVEGNLNFFEEFLSILKTPYQYKENYDAFMIPPDANFENKYQTFCGT